MVSVDQLYLISPTGPLGRCAVVPFGSLMALVTPDASSAVVAFIVMIVLPSASMVIAPVPESVTVTLELSCDIEFVDTVAKLRFPEPSVLRNWSAEPSAVG